MALTDKEIAAMTSSKTPEWGTPWELFWNWNGSYNFDLDVCATPQNAKCSRYFTKEDDGLTQEWKGRVWMNPPYGKEIGKWVEKAVNEWFSGNAQVVVCLLPARTDTKWFHEWVYGVARLVFLRGRVRFVDENGKQGAAALFPSMIAIYGGP